MTNFRHVRDLVIWLRERDERLNKGDFLDLRGTFLTSFRDIEGFLRKDPPSFYTSEAIPADAFFQQVLNAGKAVLLTSPGGSGKTHFLIDLVYTALKRGRVPFWLDLTKRRLSSGVNGHFGTEQIFDSATIAGDFGALKDAKGAAFVVADGLNEQAGSREQVMDELIKLRATGSVPVIIGDRLSSRVSSQNCQAATLWSLSICEIRKHVGSSLNGLNNWHRLLSSPFFLSLYLRVREHEAGKMLTRKEIFHRYFKKHVFKLEFEDWTLAPIATSAFTFYEKMKSRAAPRARWLECGFRAEDLKLLQESGALTTATKVDEDPIEFRHQLLHDWLAAFHLAYGGEASWTNDNFEILTLTLGYSQGSFDAVGLAAEQVPSDRITGFLICAYDWNWLSVLRVILDFEQRQHGGESPVERGFRDAIFALNALRQFDLFEHTQSAVKNPQSITPS